MTANLTVPLLALAASALAAAPAGPGPYESFAEDGRGARFLRLARRAFLPALLGREVLPRPTREMRRPAGPRDVPAPPEWPGGPAALLLCVELEGEVRGCEGELEPPAGSTGSLATELAERLAAGGSRGSGALLREDDLPGASLRAWFLLPLDGMSYREYKASVKAGETDPFRTAAWVRGTKGQVFLPPGEVRSLGEVIKVARRAGAAGLFRRPERVRVFRPVEAARPLPLGERPDMRDGR